MNKKLNEEYFETRKKHKEGYKKNKLTFKKAIINLVITIILIVVYNALSKGCSKRIEENKIKYEQKQQLNKEN
ncbi:hypothetical protein [Tenacibaculum larymnensis]|uniref:Uncharacterized protein n=1 Tax=Tenacibaculum larymnensis TaxID=2878201 RepID=A0A9X4IRP5_9FLAO|nr:hypothetical protein [Tenacibaculum larymnensis]MDE1208451.1 hypothetical protein [Tenacibaculum larymnensis]